MEKSKRLFMGLLLLALAILSIFVGGVWYLNFFGFSLLSKGVLIIISLALSVFALLLILGILGIVLTLRLGQPIKPLIIPTKVVISYFLPIIIHLGGLLGLDKESIQSSFINVSNQLINPSKMKLSPDDIMVLVPHCIQNSECNYRVTSNLNNCKRCGRCQVQDLIEVTEKYGIHLAIATGGTLARKIIKEIRPKAIIAVACERDLSSGIQDIYPMPVIGVVNLRPHGPCINTGVEVEKIEEAIQQLISNK
ncbi:hypothetical protein U472_01665 [Orenia metallireducens]|uniref:DUF116 domain-containing protein n=1 Tax=Orenia metallireducens TaxID=1413210 RepID=A0A1C0AC35_9FIRM|nr:DUF116 domain-containing protein [Orenia metallireducens]OCL27935.1 hypothetical protein U472_01665 [Orenia metallireducens]